MFAEALSDNARHSAGQGLHRGMSAPIASTKRRRPRPTILRARGLAESITWSELRGKTGRVSESSRCKPGTGPL